MRKKEVEERLKLLERLGGIIREESKAYGIIDAVWGLAILIGFLSFQVIELINIPWYYGLGILIVSLASAFISTFIMMRRLKERFGYYGGGWLSERIRTCWLAIAMVGGTSYMIVFWSPPVARIILENLPSTDISGFILIGWLIIDGIGAMVQGIISESKAYTAIGLAMVISAIIVANIDFKYAWSAFALTFGLGYLVAGIRDYSIFKQTSRQV